MKIDLGTIVQLATAIPTIVKKVQEAFGHKSGTERKDAAMSAAADVVAVTNGLAKKEVLDDAGVAALLSEAIELGVQSMKIEQRLREIDDLVKAAKGSGAAA